MPSLAMRSRLLTAIEFLVPLAALLAISIPLHIRHRDLVTSDAPAYIRRAVYLAQGDFYNSVSSYWSPLFIWVTAAFIRAGSSPNHAAHIAQQSLAAIGVFSFTLLLRRTLSLPWWIRAAAASSFAAFIAAWSIRNISPDGVLASLLLLYLATLAHPRFHQQRIWPILAGTAAGLAYLSKAYGLPFVLLHLPLTLLLFRRRPELSLRQRLRSLLLATIPLAIIAGTWIAVLSVKYHGLTIACVGPRAHALVGPVMRQRYYNELRLPPDPFAMAWENPEELRYDFWSPFDSLAHLRYQAGIILGNLHQMIRDLHWIAFGYAGVVVLLAALLAVCIRRIPLADRRQAAWVLATLLLYASGLLCVFYLQRYIFHLAFTLILLLGLMLVSNWRNTQPARSSWRAVVAGLLILPFAVAGLTKAREVYRSSYGTQHYQALANYTKKHKLPGPVAAGDAGRGIVFAHYAGRKLIGFPPTGDNLRECFPSGPPVSIDDIDRQLHDAHVGLLLVTRSGDESTWADPGIAVAKRPGWRLLAKSGPMELYAPSW